MFSTATLIQQYKSHIWGISEYSNGAIILASASQLRRLDKMQRYFLHQIGVTDSEAFVVYNFAPPSLRCRIGILGFIHKRILHQCHPSLISAMPLCQDQRNRYHDKSLETYLDGVIRHDRLYFRSLYGYMHMYNRLPQHLVDLPSVKSFQTKLTHMAKHRAQSDDVRWRQSFEDCAEILRQCHN